MKFRYKSNQRVKIFKGNALKVLQSLPRHLAQIIITSPPFFDLRSYGKEAVVEWQPLPAGCDIPHPMYPKYKCELGREEYLGTYIYNLTLTFREAWRVLKPNGTLWIEIGDKYKDKELLGVPWKLAFALREDGWKIRAEDIWEKPNARPDGGTVRDRPHRTHSTVFLFSKRDKYFYDFDAVRVKTGREATEEEYAAALGTNPGADRRRYEEGFRKHSRALTHPLGRALRSVWRINTASTKESWHFSVFPDELARIPILAGSKPGDIVLDPFCGSGSAGRVAIALGRDFIGIDVRKKCCAATWKECNAEL